jgi:hypothetical protein
VRKVHSQTRQPTYGPVEKSKKFPTKFDNNVANHVIEQYFFTKKQCFKQNVVLKFKLYCLKVVQNQSISTQVARCQATNEKKKKQRNRPTRNATTQQPSKSEMIDKINIHHFYHFPPLKISQPAGCVCD